MIALNLDVPRAVVMVIGAVPPMSEEYKWFGYEHK